jgi:Protein of unknown function (DUF3072)
MVASRFSSAELYGTQGVESKSIQAQRSRTMSIAGTRQVIEPMTKEQAAELKELSEKAFERDAFKPHLTAAEAERRIAALKAKLRMLDAPPHAL